MAEVFGGSISAHYEGTATITATANGTGYTAECSVTVKKDEAEAIRSSVDGTEPLAFSSFLSTLRSRCTEKTGGSLSYLSSISVSPKQGVLYYGYVSADAPGHGVGGSEEVLLRPRQRAGGHFRHFLRGRVRFQRHGRDRLHRLRLQRRLLPRHDPCERQRRQRRDPTPPPQVGR